MSRSVLLRTTLLFALSGVSGLVYQVLWVRQLGNLFGNTIHSAAVVTAVFMLGLGVGSVLGGRYVDRRGVADPGRGLRAYGLAELAIAALGLGLSVALPRLGPLTAGTLVYAPTAEGWWEPSLASVALRYVAGVLLLGPPTLLMGATLTMLIASVIGGELSRSGRRTGLLYGANTLGAAVGAFATDFVFVPSVGLAATAGVAALLNLLAGLGALRLARALAVRPTDAPAPASSPPPGLRLRGVALALAAAGFVGMGLEMLWFRYLGTIIGHQRSVFSLLLAVILVAMWAGSTVGGALATRLRRPALLYLAAALAVVPLAMFGLTSPRRQAIMDALHQAQAAYAAAGPLGRELLVDGIVLSAIVEAVVPTSFLLGLAYPVANAVVQQVEAEVGSRAGRLYLANTVGAVLGSIVVAFVLLPALGMQRTVVALALVASLGGVAFALATLPRSARAVLPAAALVLAASVFGWSRRPESFMFDEPFLQLRRPDLKILAKREGRQELLVVTEDARGARVLTTDGYSMSATGKSAQRYMRAFAHLPLLLAERPRRALVICFGVGNTLHAASLHPLERLEVVDLSRDILEHARFFAATNGDVLASGRVAVFVNDGRNHVLAQPPETYDLITLEPPPIALAGLASLYSSDFYALAKARLRSGGFVSQWLPAYQVSREANLAIVRAFLDVFPNAVLLSGAGPELILLGRRELPITVDPATLAAGLAASLEVRADLERIGLGSVTEIVATFGGDAETLAAATRGVAPVTDDFPSMEYGNHLMIGPKEIPAELFDVSGARRFCPGCFQAGRPIPALPELGPRLSAQARLYASPGFRFPRN